MLSTNRLPGQERRRSQRVFVTIRLEVEWTTPEGQKVRARAETEEVNAHGAMLRIHTRHRLSATLRLKHLLSGESVEAQAVWTDTPTPEGAQRVAVSLRLPSETFWGVSIPPLVRKSSE